MARTDVEVAGPLNGGKPVQHRQKVRPLGQGGGEPGHGLLQHPTDLLPVPLFQGNEEGQTRLRRGAGEDEVCQLLPLLTGLMGLLPRGRRVSHRERMVGRRSSGLGLRKRKQA